MQADATRNALSGAVGTLRKVVSEDGVRSASLLAKSPNASCMELLVLTKPGHSHALSLALCTLQLLQGSSASEVGQDAEL